MFIPYVLNTGYNETERIEIDIAACQGCKLAAFVGAQA
jgi:hypothetical protein